MANTAAIFRVICVRLPPLHEVMWESPPTIPQLLYGLGSMTAPTVSELADCCGLTIKNASRALKILRARGWVVFEGDKRDERKKLVKLTPSGQHIMRAVQVQIMMLCTELIATAQQGGKGR